MIIEVYYDRPAQKIFVMYLLQNQLGLIGERAKRSEQLMSDIFKKTKIKYYTIMDQVIEIVKDKNLDPNDFFITTCRNDMIVIGGESYKVSLMEYSRKNVIVCKG